MLDGSWLMAQGSWLMAKGGQGRLMAHGSWPGAGPALGTQGQAPGPGPGPPALGSPGSGRPLAMSHEPPLAMSREP